MYLFFTIAGFLFIFLSSVVIYNIYLFFPINKVTNFLNPTVKTIWNKINICIIPIIAWAYVEIPILGTNPYFVMALLLNTCINSALMYVIRYGNLLVNGADNKCADIFSIFIASLLGQVIAYITLLLNVRNTKMLLVSILGLLLYTAFIVMLKIWPPKSKFFRGEQ